MAKLDTWARIPLHLLLLLLLLLMPRLQRNCCWLRLCIP